MDMTQPNSNPGTDLTVVQRAALALGATEREKELRALAAKHTNITTVRDFDSRNDCHSAYMELKNERVDLEKRGKTARDDAQAFVKAVIGEEKRLIGIISTEEDRLKGLRDAWDQEQERKRLEEAEREAKRVAGHMSAIDRIKGVPAHAVGKTAKELEELLESVRVMEIGPDFEEFRVEAEDAQRSALAQLSVMLTGVRAQEAQNADYERLKKEEADRRAKAEEEARAVAAAEEKRRQEAIVAQEKELAERRAQQEKELAEERAKHAADLAAQREEQLRRDAEARVAREAEEKRLADLAEELAMQEREAAQRREQEAREAQERANADLRINTSGRVLYEAMTRIRAEALQTESLFATNVTHIIDEAFAEAGLD